MPGPNYYFADTGDIPVGAQPASTGTRFGGSSGASAAMGEMGNLLSAASAGINPGVINQDNVVAVYTLPAGSFDVAKRALELYAAGSVASNVNSKRMKMWVNPTTPVVGQAISGGTLIADSGAYTTTGAAGWALSAEIVKYGAAGSNTQIAIHTSAQVGLQIGALLAAQALTLNEAAPITIAVTINCVTALTDAALNYFEVLGEN